MNCNKNENSVFSQPSFQTLFQPYNVVKLYTDDVPRGYYAPSQRDQITGERQKSDAEKVNLAFQKAVFDTEELPLYAIVEPQADGRIHVIATYQGLITDNASFAEFLRDPEGAKK